MKNLSFLLITIFFMPFTLYAQSGWVQQTSGTTEDLYSVFFINEDVGWAVGDAGAIIHTTDGGDNWNTQVSNTTDDLYYVKFMDEDNGWVIGGILNGLYDCGILKTTNGGETWSTMSIPGPSFFLTPNIGWSRDGDFGESLLKTTNGGLSWDSISTGFSEDYYMSCIHFINENIGFIQMLDAVSGSGGTTTQRTSDGGQTWNHISQIGIGGGSFCFVNNTIGWFSGLRDVPPGYISKTEDAGLSWDEQYTGNFVDIFFVDENKGWALFFDYNDPGDSIIYTTDGGENWETQHLTTPVILKSVYFINENIGWMVGENGAILYTTTGGVVTVEEEHIEGGPTEYLLIQNYPNPFNPSTKIKYSISSVGTRDRVAVQIIVYDVLGNEVATLVNEEKPPGTYEVEFNAVSHSGNVRNLPSGIYFYRLQAGDFVETRKMLFLK